MNRKTLSAAVLAVAISLSAPLVLADRGGHHEGRDGYREIRVERVERHYYQHDNGHHRGWHKQKHHGHHDDYGPAPRGYREHYPERRTSSPAPIILGSVIGGVVGHEIGYGDPGHTAVGAVIGTVIGYEIARHR